MSERRNSIEPRLRPGEQAPEVREGKIATRHYGEIVFISAPSPDDVFYNKSPYTIKQVEELEAIRRANVLNPQSKTETLFDVITRHESKHQ